MEADFSQLVVGFLVEGLSRLFTTAPGSTFQLSICFTTRPVSCSPAVLLSDRFSAVFKDLRNSMQIPKGHWEAHWTEAIIRTLPFAIQGGLLPGQRHALYRQMLPI